MTTDWFDRLGANTLCEKFGAEAAPEIAVRELNRGNASEDGERARTWGGIVAVLLYEEEKRLAA